MWLKTKCLPKSVQSTQVVGTHTLAIFINLNMKTLGQVDLFDFRIPKVYIKKPSQYQDEVYCQAKVAANYFWYS